MKIYNIKVIPFDKSIRDDKIHSTVFFSRRLLTRRHDRVPRILIPARLRVGRKSIIAPPMTLDVSGLTNRLVPPRPFNFSTSKLQKHKQAIILLLALALSPERKLDKYPGPLLAKFSRLWLARQAGRGNRFEVVHELHKKYGKSGVYSLLC